jgi:uncharacterized protein YjdB
VDNNGSVTGYHDGITILTATSLDNPTINSSVQVTIKTIPVETITMNISETTINVNGTVLLSATVLPLEATDQTVTWYCTNPEAASISVQMNPYQCLVTGLSSGLAIINATTPNNKITNSYVYVGIIPVASVTLSQHTVNLDENEKIEVENFIDLISCNRKN